MNFFAKKNEQLKSKESIIEPIELYNSLEKEKDYIYLRGVQEEVLKEWHTRRNESNILIKMNTGAGKTLTGLLMLYSKMMEHNSPVIYLCPDNQLLNQVVEQSKKYNIPTCLIDNNNDFPEGFLNSESILVTTINRMFNGKNIFDRDRIRPNAIVIDDAHRCVEKVIQSYTVQINHKLDLYEELLDLFEDDLKQQSIASYEGLTSRQVGFYMKVPFWSWFEKLNQVIPIMMKYLKEKFLLFKWKLIEDNLTQYEMYIDINKIEISPMMSMVNNVIAYSKVKYKYALSATFMNDYSLLKDLDFSYSSVLNPITPIDRKDYGQRLILTPKRYFNDLSDDEHIEILKHHINNNQNVVVLVPSNRKASDWEEYGAKVIDKNSIDDEIDNLRETKGNFVVFVNRYEGIDLSGHSCNVLVIDGYPKFKFIKEEYYQSIHHETSANLIAQTIEQGMGRSVRSGSDYSVVYLFGREILKFLRAKSNHDYFNTHTNKQIKLGLSLFDGDKKETKNNVELTTEIADYCLSQDDGWKEYYKNFMNSEIIIDNSVREQKLKVIYLEKKAIHNFLKNKYKESIRAIHEILKKNLDSTQKAWYYQYLAIFSYSNNKNTSNDYLIKAKELNSRFPIPFLSKQRYKIQHTKNQYANALKFIKSFSTINDLLLFIVEILNFLKFDPKNKAEEFENTIENLGNLLGFKSTRPEKNDNDGGPDNLWVSNDYFLILESKSEKKSKNKIYKKDIEQLYHSIVWFNEKFKFEGNVIGVTLQPNISKNDDVAIDENVKALGQNKINLLRESLSLLKEYLSHQKISNIDLDEVKVEYDKLGFNMGGFINKYLSKIN